MGVLSGYRVIDISIAMAGPLAAQKLGDLGADVIKVEPVTGEWQRHKPAGGAKGNKVNASFLSLNRNKRSLAIDLKHESTKSAFQKLITSTDILIQNYRPGVAERLEFDYASIKKINPNIVYVSISGYGSSGPDAYLAGQDLLLQARSGAMYSTGPKSQVPMPAGHFVADTIAASTAFEAALAALFHREKTGEGQQVEVNMLDSIIASQMQEYGVFLNGNVKQERSEENHGHCYIRSPYGVFKSQDGYIAIVRPDMEVLAEVLNIPSFAELENDDEDRLLRDEIQSKTQDVIKEKSTKHWLKLFKDNDIWSSDIFSYEDVVNDPQVKHNGTFIEYQHKTEGLVTVPGFPMKFSETPCDVRLGAPQIGEHSVDILLSVGVSQTEIETMVYEGALTNGEV